MRIIRSVAAVGVMAAGLTTSGCAFMKLGGELSPEGARATFEKLKSLEGTWNSTPESAMQGSLVYRVVGAGSTVQETIFPGTPHEMVTMYHMDGDALVLTHYCAAGNQPRMRAVLDKSAHDIVFRFTGLGNGDPSKDMHMHEAEIDIGADGHLRSHWTGWDGGKPGGHEAKFDLVRAQ